jgi:hypothetical protein
MSTRRQRIGYWKKTHGYVRDNHITTIAEAIITPIILLVFFGAFIAGVVFLGCGGKDNPCGLPLTLDTEGIAIFSFLGAMLVIIWASYIAEGIDNKINHRY